MRVVGDGPDAVAQLIQGRQVHLECGLGADLFGLGTFGHRPVVDAAGQPVQRRPDRAAEHVGDFGIAERRQRPDGLDTQPVQLLLGDGPDPPQPAHRQGFQERPLLFPTDDAHPVGLGQP